MTEEAFRILALSIAGVREGSHMGRTDFRIGPGAGRVFATLESPEEGWVMVRLPPEEQERVLGDDSFAARVANGAWGAAGCTHVQLSLLTRAKGLKLLVSAAEFRLARVDAKKAATSRGGMPGPGIKAKRRTR